MYIQDIIDSFGKTADVTYKEVCADLFIACGPLDEKDEFTREKMKQLVENMMDISEFTHTPDVDKSIMMIGQHNCNDIDDLTLVVR
jgi:hypothetical protein